jgi:adenylate kinase
MGRVVEIAVSRAAGRRPLQASESHLPTSPARHDRAIILLGPPGCGKGTQGRRIAEALKVPIVSSGDILRENISRRTELGVRAQRAVDRGELVSDELILEMLLRRLSEADCERGFVLDGIPRTVRQAEFLETRLHRRDGSRLSFSVVALDMDDQKLANRVTGRRICQLCGATYNLKTRPPLVENRCDIDGSSLKFRSDDGSDTFAKRLAEYRAASQPIHAYLSARHGVIPEIDCDRDVEEITSQLLELILMPRAHLAFASSRRSAVRQ